MLPVHMKDIFHQLCKVENKNKQAQNKMNVALFMKKQH